MLIATAPNPPTLPYLVGGSKKSKRLIAEVLFAVLMLKEVVMPPLWD